MTLALSRLVLAIAALLFACVAALLVYTFSAAHRHETAGARPLAGQPGPVRRELAWTALSACLLLVLFILAV